MVGERHKTTKITAAWNSDLIGAFVIADVFSMNCPIRNQHPAVLAVHLMATISVRVAPDYFGNEM
ncbi:MAG: hypothetical protein WC581_13195 [Thermodesulfovibrionales bacterium]